MITIKETKIDEYSVHLTLSDGKTVTIIPQGNGLLLHFAFVDIEKAEQIALNHAKITYKERK